MQWKKIGRSQGNTMTEIVRFFLLFFFSRDVFLSYVDVTFTVEVLQISYTRYALMAIEQWGFFSVPHLLSHGVSIYNGNLKGPVTLAHVIERLVM